MINITSLTILSASLPRSQTDGFLLPARKHLVACRENIRILPIRLKAKMKMRNAPKPWTRKEEEELRALILGGKSAEAIAMKLGRTPHVLARVWASLRNRAKHRSHAHSEQYKDDRRIENHRSVES